MEKIIGILGGMGPEATLTLFEKIIKYTPASRDQDHIRIIIDNNPKIPDRTAAIIGDGEDPVPMLVQSGQLLENAGADVVVIPCISAHFFLDSLRTELRIPILSVFDEAADQMKHAHPGIRVVGLLATTGTIQGGLFQKRLEKDNIQTLLLEPEDQEQVMSAIYRIKGAPGDRRESKASLKRCADRLIDKGAGAVIAGCTEIPLALESQDIAVPLMDTLSVLARAAVRAAKGRG